jgi:hypothetical protein
LPHFKKTLFSKNFLLNKLDQIFPILSHLHLTGYVESIHLLFSKLAKLNGTLKLVEIEFSIESTDFFRYTPKKNKFSETHNKKTLKSLMGQNRLKLETLSLKRTELFNIVPILANYVDLDSLGLWTRLASSPDDDDDEIASKI